MRDFSTISEKQLLYWARQGLLIAARDLSLVSTNVSTKRNSVLLQMYLIQADEIAERIDELNNADS